MPRHLLVSALRWWTILALYGITNGAFRRTVLLPVMTEEQAHRLSCLTLMVLMLAVSWFFVRRFEPRCRAEWIRVGLLWLVCTVAFEFAFGRLVVGSGWDTLLADYDLARGRLWLLVLLTVLAGPCVAAMVRDTRGNRHVAATPPDGTSSRG